MEKGLFGTKMFLKIFQFRFFSFNDHNFLINTKYKFTDGNDLSDCLHFLSIQTQLVGDFLMAYQYPLEIVP